MEILTLMIKDKYSTKPPHIITGDDIKHLYCSEDALTMEENDEVMFATQEPIHFATLEELLEEKLKKEIISLRDHEIIKQYEKVQAALKKLNTMIAEESFRQSQISLETGLAQIVWDIENEDVREDGESYLTREEWDIACKVAYSFSKQFRTDTEVYEKMREAGYRRPYYRQIASIYIPFISGDDKKEDSTAKMDKLRKEWVK